MKPNRQSWREANRSFWEKEHYFTLWDCIIIGSGIVGLSTAIELKQLNPKLDIAVIDRGVIPVGASTRNAGFACIGSPTELLADIEAFGEEYCIELIKMRWEGLRRLRERLGDDALEYKATGGYEIFFSEDRETYLNVCDNIPELNRLVKKATGMSDVFSHHDRMPGAFGLSKVDKIIGSTLEAQINPAKMIDALSRIAVDKGVRLFHGAEVKSVAKDSGVVHLSTEPAMPLQARCILIATNGFAKGLLPDMDVRPARNVVIVSHPVPGLQLDGCFHYDRGYVYFRNIGNRVLIGGARNLDPQGETTEAFEINTVIKDHLEAFLHNKLFPGSNIGIDTVWSGILGIGAHKGPIVEEYQPKIFTAVRMGGMGIAIGSEIGRKAARMVLNNL